MRRFEDRSGQVWGGKLDVRLIVGPPEVSPDGTHAWHPAVVLSTEHDYNPYAPGAPRGFQETLDCRLEAIETLWRLS